MQVPASATAAPGAHNATDSVSSSLIETLSGSSAVKRKQAAPFAAILAEQSPNVSAPKDGDVLPGAKEDNSPDARREAVLSGAGMKSKDVLIATLLQPKAIESVSSDLQSDGATPAKGKTEMWRHRKNAPTSSDHPGKKQQAATSVDSVILSAVVTPVPLAAAPPTPVLAEKGPHFTTGIPLNHSLTAEITQTAHDRKLEAQIPGLPEFAKPEETLSLTADSVRHDSGPDSLSFAKLQPSPSPEVVAHAGQSNAQAMHAHGPAQRLRDFSPLAGLEHGGSSATVSSAGAGMQNAAAPSAMGAFPKLKLPNKTPGDAVRKLVNLTASGVPSSAPASSPDNSLTLASFKHESTGGLSAKPADALIEANAFQHLDAGESPATLLHCSPHQVAIGVHDPLLGWVEVQTQSSAGHINATLTTASLEAHASLAAQSPAITQFLADRNVSIHSVNVHTQMGAQSGGSGNGQPQPGSGGAYQGPSELRSSAARISSRSLSNETANGNMPALNASRISVRA